MNTCDTCKHWGIPFLNSGYASCIKLGASPDYPKNQAQSTTAEKGADGPEIETGPKFGCVHWEAE